ncbi:MAG: glutamate-5-semialdehyde dehydrogenase [Candidatus Gracilibacteria bacterium]|jgi:glutamate-5-semialdehyde dehydrogenase|nr:glutamate-5-semialdehyde dehydrogenase [Candidatus Gracilibacteria bacterium]
MLLDDIKKTNISSKDLALISDDLVNKVLLEISEEVLKNEDFLLSANKKDLERMSENDPKYDRLKLTHERLEGIAQSIRDIAFQDTPIGTVLDQKVLENGISLNKIRVPLGVVAIVFEARPNVFFDCFALCFKTKNACILKGSQDAEDSNAAIYKLIKDILERNGVDSDIVLFPSSERESLAVILNAQGLVDIAIPRGGRGLIDYVRENAYIPVIETGAGIVHVYMDKGASVDQAKDIVYNAKTSRPSVCNALDCLVIHEGNLPFLVDICAKLADKKVEILADEVSYEVLKNSYPFLKKATEEDFGCEFLGYQMSIKTVGDIKEAVQHIDKYSSRHTECILSRDQENIDYFTSRIDAAVVFVNASTRFTDGGVFGLGAEIGISTQKLHARGPMGTEHLTTYKWVGFGDGQVRN